MSWARRFQERNALLNSARFPGADSDPWAPYRALVKKFQNGSVWVLDLGAGPLDASREWVAPHGGTSPARVISIDVEWSSLRKNTGAYRVVAEGGKLPFAEDSIDLVLSRYAFEHVRRPRRMMKELARVLKPRKKLLFITPHRWCYVSLISRVTPLWFHRLVYRLSDNSSENLPYCPAYYRMNTPGKIRSCAHKAGFDVCQISVTVGPPEYTKILPPVVHRAFIWFHSLLERSPRLRYQFGVNLWVVLEKQQRPFASSEPSSRLEPERQPGRIVSDMTA